jgi:hypothetical protein
MYLPRRNWTALTRQIRTTGQGTSLLKAPLDGHLDHTRIATGYDTTKPNRVDCGSRDFQARMVEHIKEFALEYSVK